MSPGRLSTPLPMNMPTRIAVAITCRSHLVFVMYRPNGQLWTSVRAPKESPTDPPTTISLGSKLPEMTQCPRRDGPRRPQLRGTMAHSDHQLTEGLYDRASPSPTEIHMTAAMASIICTEHPEEHQLTGRRFDRVSPSPTKLFAPSSSIHENGEQRTVRAHHGIGMRKVIL